MTQREEIQKLRHEVSELKSDVTLFRKQLKELEHRLSRHHPPPTPTCIAITFEGASHHMPTLAANQKITASAAEFDSAGARITPEPASLEWTLSDETIARIETNPDGTATINATAEGSVTVNVKDNQNNLTSSAVLTITAPLPEQPPVNPDQPVPEPGTPVTIAIEFGDPS